MPASRWCACWTKRRGSAASPGAHHVELGGFTLSGDGKRLVVVATEDNLLKGAATQALQNLNMAFGLDEFLGIPL
jgi:N-acetyl-gamma-glutamyl-phosphate reductase